MTGRGHARGDRHEGRDLSGEAREAGLVALREIVALTAAELERRRAARVCVVPHRIRMGRHDGHLLDVSETGALVHAARPQAPNHHVAVEFELDSERVTLIARVVRCIAHPVTLLNGAVWHRHEYRVALEFLDYGSRGRTLIRDLIARA